MSLRRADFAGAWNPGRKSECIKAIEEFVETDLTCPSSERQKMGGIVPHAGWFFSGRIACHVIKCLKSENDPDTIIIFGKHLHPGSSNSIMKEGRWDTPLGGYKN